MLIELPLDFAGELRRIEHVSKNGDRFRVAARWSCTPESIARLLASEAPEIVHIVAPGVDAQRNTWLCDRHGGLLKVPPAELSSLFDGLAARPKLTVVNTCDSLPVAAAVSSKVGAAIGMNGEISDLAAIHFTGVLYDRLAEGKDVSVAFDAACDAIPRDQHRVPVLLEGLADPTDLKLSSSEPRPRESSTAEVRTLMAFCSYAHEDDRFRENLVKHLSLLRRQGLIQVWHDRLLHPGDRWAEEIDKNLDLAELVVLLISADFMESDYCFGVEMRRALERHESGEAKVMPVLVRPCDWECDELSSLHVLPTDAKPVSSWSNRDAAWTDVAAGIRDEVTDLKQKSAE